MLAHFRPWRGRVALACLVTLIPQLWILWDAQAAPDMAVAALGAQQSTPPPPPVAPQSIELSRIKEGLQPSPDLEGPQKQAAASQALLKAKLENAKRDAATLLELAQSLKIEIDQGNVNVVPLTVVKKAEKIEKLAKKLRKWSTAE